MRLRFSQLAAGLIVVACPAFAQSNPSAGMPISGLPKLLGFTLGTTTPEEALGWFQTNAKRLTVVSHRDSVALPASTKGSAVRYGPAYIGRVVAWTTAYKGDYPEQPDCSPMLMSDDNGACQLIELTFTPGVDGIRLMRIKSHSELMPKPRTDSVVGSWKTVMGSPPWTNEYGGGWSLGWDFENRPVAKPESYHMGPPLELRAAAEDTLGRALEAMTHGLAIEVGILYGFFASPARVNSLSVDAYDARRRRNILLQQIAISKGAAVPAWLSR